MRALTVIYITLLNLIFSSNNILTKPNLVPAVRNLKSFQKESTDESRNRFPQILHDVKILLADVVIADHHLDTLEVIFNLSRIYDLLMEADQIGQMTQEDQEEFERFEKSFLDIYTHKLVTMNSADAPVTAERFRNDITEAIEPLKIEMGDSKFTVIDDRDGHIPLVRNKQVDQFITYFTAAKGRKQFEVWMKRYQYYKNLILPILKKNEIPEEIYVLAMIESGLNPKAYSRANASGMWQFIYSTGKSYGLDRDWYVDERRDIIKSTQAACEYLKEMNKLFDNWYLTIAAYNCGQGRVLRASKLHQTYDFWQMHSLPKETRNYIPYYLAAAIITRDPASYGFSIPKVEPFEYDEVVLDNSADLSVLARVAGITLKEIRNFNPELRQSATPASINYSLKLPKEKKAHFESAWNTIPESERFAPQFVVHRIKYGESLWTISKKYGASIHDIASVNKIKNRSKIRVGTKLKVPMRGGIQRTWGTTDNGGPAGHYKIVYKVKRGDTLGQIAEDYKTKASKIRRWNGLKYGSQIIYPGQKLTLWVRKG